MGIEQSSVRLCDLFCRDFPTLGGVGFGVLEVDVDFLKVLCVKFEGQGHFVVQGHDEVNVEVTCAL